MTFKIEYIYRGVRNTTQINGRTSAEAVENFKENYIGTICKIRVN